MQNYDNNIGIENKPSKKFIKKYLKEGIFYISLIVFFLYINPTFISAKTEVSGSSMEQTLHDKDVLFMEKISYLFNSPQRFDIIIFNPNKENPKEYYVKRIIGLPGETIQIKDGEVYINDTKLDEDVYGNTKVDEAGLAQDPLLIPEGEYFVMGDNRIGSESNDSRYSDVGTISKSKIKGKVAVRVYPFDSIHLFE